MINPKIIQPTIKKGIEAMQMYADGYRTEEVLQMKTVTRHALEHHISDTQNAFDAVNRTHLMAILFRQGYLK